MMKLAWFGGYDDAIHGRCNNYPHVAKINPQVKMIAVSGLGATINWRQLLASKHFVQALHGRGVVALPFSTTNRFLCKCLCYERVVEKLTKIEILILKLVLKLGL